MHDQVLVRVQHRLAHGAHQLQPLAHRERAAAAVVAERLSFDVLHRDPRRPVVERPGVVQAGDGRVIELRQRALLEDEALAPRGGEPGVAQDLDRRHARQVASLSEIDDPHPSLAEHAGEAIRSKRPAGDRGARRVGKEDVRDVRHAPVEERSAGCIAGQQRLDRLAATLRRRRTPRGGGRAARPARGRPHDGRAPGRAPSAPRCRSCAGA